MTTHYSEIDEAETVARCPICGHAAQSEWLCKHVRWTFDQGDPMDFARHVVKSSPYTAGCGLRPSDVNPAWWSANGERVFDLITLHFEAAGGYVFGDLKDVDLLARDIWRMHTPEQERQPLVRH